MGDYVNRGPSSPGVVDRLLELKNATFLRGNHDELFDLMLNGECYIERDDTPDAMSAFRWFMQYGLDATLTAYGADYAELDFLTTHPDLDRLTRVLEIGAGKTPALFPLAATVAEYDHFFVAHAFWNPDEPDTGPDIAARLNADVKLRTQILWGRYTESQILQNKHWKRTGYFGHTPVTNYHKDGNLTCVTGPQIVLLDTGAALGVNGRLTAICADSGEIVQVDRTGVLVGM